MSSNSYDQLPYPSLSYGQTHPAHLATLALLRGMSPAPVERCRVLELGCAGGGNLVPIAYTLPDSQFVGVDYSLRQIQEGQAAVEALGLSNVQLLYMDMMDLDDSLGQFDYIIAHGVLSWVPPAVQDRVLDICRQNLAEQGVAYVSYNTNPGWRLMGIIRDLMLYHTRNLLDPLERVAQARAVLDLIAAAVPAQHSAYGSFINMYADMLRGDEKSATSRGDAFLFHDELEDVNESFYFYQFIEMAQAHQLQYVGEAKFSLMLDSDLSAETIEQLNQISHSLIELEQYKDFLRNRMFRQTLLCHQHVPLSRTLDAGLVTRLYVAGHTRWDGELSDLRSDEVARFQGADEAVISTNHPATKAAMVYLSEIWPQAVPFVTLLRTARARLNVNTDELEDAQVMAVNLLRAYATSSSLAQLTVSCVPLAVEPSERPVASRVARFQARRGDRVTNLRHERVDLDGLDRYILALLDGEHDVDAVVESLWAGPVAEGYIQIEAPGDAPQRARQSLRQAVEKRLRWLGRAALLLG